MAECGGRKRKRRRRTKQGGDDQDVKSKFESCNVLDHEGLLTKVDYKRISTLNSTRTNKGNIAKSESFEPQSIADSSNYQSTESVLLSSIDNKDGEEFVTRREKTNEAKSSLVDKSQLAARLEKYIPNVSSEFDEPVDFQSLKNKLQMLLNSTCNNNNKN